MLYIAARALLRGLYRIVYRLEATGRSNIPPSGPLILCANHTSLIDPTTVGTPLRRRMHFMAKIELFSIPGFGWLIRRLGAFPVKRGGVSKESIRLSLKLLDEGHAIVIFPEGTRSNNGGVGKKGAASLAVKSGATVIPVAIVGSYKPFRKMKIVYGEPVDMSPYAEGTSEQLETATHAILTKIRHMIAENK